MRCESKPQRCGAPVVGHLLGLLFGRCHHGAAKRCDTTAFGFSEVADGVATWTLYYVDEWTATHVREACPVSA